MGLFTRKIEKHKALLFRTALGMISEDERVYRNQVALFAAEYHPASPTPIGIMKARLHSSAFLLVAFRNRWGSSNEADCLEAFNAVSGIAVQPAVESGAVSHEEAGRIGAPFLFQQLRHIDEELSNGPSTPGTGNLSSEQLRQFSTPGALRDLPPSLGIDDPSHLERLFTQGPIEPSYTPGFLGLLESCHEAFIDSVGASAYETSVWKLAQGRVVSEGVGAIKPRTRFARMFTASIFSRLRAFAEFQSSLG